MENPPPSNGEPTDSAQNDKPKKPKLTKEEKMARKLEKKMAKAQKKIENEKEFIRDRLAREVKYSKKNYDKVKRHWLEFMNGLKSAELKRNLNVSIISIVCIYLESSKFEWFAFRVCVCVCVCMTGNVGGI